MSEQNIPFLRKDALVPMEIGAGFVNKLYELSMFIVADKSDEQLEALNAAIKNETTDSEPWMKHYYTVLLLLKSIEEQAVAHKLVEYRSANELDS